MINIKPLTLALALTFGSAHLMAADTVHSASDVMNAFVGSGFVATHDLEYRYGVWTAESTAPNGERVDLVFDPTNGQVTALNRAALGTTALDAADVRALLAAQGYTTINDIEFDDGLWQAKALNAFRQRVYLVIHPVTGAILNESTHGQPSTPGASLSAAEIVQRLESAGYRYIHDLEFDDGVWEADAINARGQRVEIKVDPVTSGVLREKLDD